jgi:ferredoxin-type protein NapF
VVDASRRGFLRGRPSPKAEIRPPWALAEALFINHCTRCNDCLPACPQHIVIAGDGGYPTVDFSRNECTFCGECTKACRPQALMRHDDQPPWTIKALISDLCLARKGVECRICGDFCDVRAIRFTPRLGGTALPEITLETCNGCGACVAPCPTGAIAIR